jgi:hypothetical protein
VEKEVELLTKCIGDLTLSPLLIEEMLLLFFRSTREELKSTSVELRARLLNLYIGLRRNILEERRL